MMNMLKGAVIIMLLHTKLPSRRLKRPKSMLSRYNYQEHQKNSKLQIAIKVICKKQLIEPENAHIAAARLSLYDQPGMKTTMAVKYIPRVLTSLGI